jgi:hypothetical protein
VRARDSKWCGGFPPPLRLSDRSEGDVEGGNRSQRTSSYVPPAPLQLLYTCSVTGTHNHQLVGAPDQGARSNRPETWSHAVGRPLGSIQQMFVRSIWLQLAMAKEVVFQPEHAKNHRALSPKEVILRRELKFKCLGLTSLACSIAWQRSQLTFLCEGDADTRLFHLQACHRGRKTSLIS